jgi:Replication initiator protein A
VFEFAHLHAKSGSLARVSDFALDIRRIAARQRLPGYRLLIERKGRTELLRILPADPSTVPVNNPVNRLGRSGARVSADQAQTVSAEQAHQLQSNPWAERQSRAANLESNRESNSSALTRAQESRSAGAEFHGPVGNTVDSHPISTTASAEEPTQDSRDVNRRPKPERSKR